MKPIFKSFVETNEGQDKPTDYKKKNNQKMKAFFQKNGSVTSPNSMNQFGAGTVLSGDLKSEADIRIDGKIKGSVSTKAKLVLGAGAVIDGDISCQNAYIEGRVNGKVEVAELLILGETAFIDGDISIKKLVVEDGAKFNGRCIMGAPAMVNMDTTTTQNEPTVRAIGQR